MTKEEQELREKIIEIQRRHINTNIWAEENADQIIVKVKEALPELAKELGYYCFGEEADLVSHYLEKGWIPPGEAKNYVKQAELREE